MTFSRFQYSHYNLLRPQTKRNDLPRTVAIRELTPYLLFFDHQRYHPQIPVKHQPAVRLLHSQPKHLSRHLEDLLARSSNLFAIVPSCAQKNLNKIVRNKLTPILNQYWEPSPDRAIDFVSLYNIVTLLNLLFYKQHYFLFGAFALVSFPITLSKTSLMATIFQCWTIKLTFCSQFIFWFMFSTTFHDNFTKNSKKINCCAIPQKKAVHHSTAQDNIKTSRRPTESNGLL